MNLWHDNSGYKYTGRATFNAYLAIPFRRTNLNYFLNLSFGGKPPSSRFLDSLLYCLLECLYNSINVPPLMFDRGDPHMAVAT